MPAMRGFTTSIAGIARSYNDLLTALSITLNSYKTVCIG